MANFKSRLRAAGFSGETDKFYRQVEELFVANFPTFDNDEHLKRHPREALRFCDLVRARLCLPNLPDDLALGALENFRKSRRRLSKTN